MDKENDSKARAEQRAAKQWERGFTACALLLSGRYEDYAIERDKWLDIIDRTIKSPKE